MRRIYKLPVQRYFAMSEKAAKINYHRRCQRCKNRRTINASMICVQCLDEMEHLLPVETAKTGRKRARSKK